jgi:hypothetical protein
MVLVGPSLGAAVAIDFSVNYPDAVHAQNTFAVYISLFTADYRVTQQIKLRYL